MKLIGAEVAVLTGGNYLQSYIEKLRLLYYKGTYDFKDEFVKLEKGGVFKDLGIKNFLEGDYFAWYLDVWDKKIEKCVLELVERLSTYEPGTVELEPESVRDLLKNLYKFLIPRKIRRSLGEYYTPDWLAEFTLDQTGYNGDIHERLLDPSCGSGTFLVAAIKRAIRFSEDNFPKYANVELKFGENTSLSYVGVEGVVTGLNAGCNA